MKRNSGGTRSPGDSLFVVTFEDRYGTRYTRQSYASDAAHARAAAKDPGGDRVVSVALVTDEPTEGGGSAGVHRTVRNPGGIRRRSVPFAQGIVFAELKKHAAPKQSEFALNACAIDIINALEDAGFDL